MPCLNSMLYPVPGEHSIFCAGTPPCILCRDSALYPVPGQHSVSSAGAAPLSWAGTAPCILCRDSILYPLEAYIWTKSPTCPALCLLFLAGCLAWLNLQPTFILWCKFGGIHGGGGIVQMSVFWFVTPWGLIDGYLHTLHVSAFKMEPKCSFETPASPYRTGECHAISTRWYVIRRGIVTELDTA
jgi:hypothetical protein